MLLPFVVGRTNLPPRSEIYSSIPWRFGGHPFFGKTIFEESKPLDIAFIGSSHMWGNVNAAQVKEKLSTDLGREAEVATLGWNWPGFDAVYFAAEDLLNHRTVKLLVVDDEYNPDSLGTMPHRLASRWFRMDNATSITDLTARQQSRYYASAVLGMSRQLLGMVRSNLPERLAPLSAFSPEQWYKCTPPADSLGALRVAKGLVGTRGSPPSPFVAYQPNTDVRPDEAIRWSSTTAQQFRPAPGEMPALQKVFTRKLAQLAKCHHVTLLFLHMPSLDDTSAPVIQESAVWPEALGHDVHMLGFTPQTLFRGLNPGEIESLFYDPQHLNSNGQDYFTRLVTPKLLEVYHDTQNP